jgi:hypothetical protein
MMSKRPAVVVRALHILLSVIAICAASGSPVSAQMRGAMKDRIIDTVANEMVASIQSDSCAQFAATLKGRKSGSGSSAGGMMKKDPTARARFVNKVAGPLLNKMIDCDLLPSR